MSNNQNDRLVFVLGDIRDNLWWIAFWLFICSTGTCTHYVRVEQAPPPAPVEIAP